MAAVEAMINHKSRVARHKEVFQVILYRNVWGHESRIRWRGQRYGCPLSYVECLYKTDDDCLYFLQAPLEEMIGIWHCHQALRCGYLLKPCFCQIIRSEFI